MSDMSNNTEIVLQTLLFIPRLLCRSRSLTTTVLKLPLAEPGSSVAARAFFSCFQTNDEEGGPSKCLVTF